MVSRGSGLAALSLAILAGCEIQKVVVPRTQPFVIVHSILDPDSRTQTVLVERSLTGAITIDSINGYDPKNPVETGGGEPVLGADVRVTDPDGIVMQGIPSAATPGVYQFSLDRYKVNLKPGRMYSLQVIADADTVTGTTLMPTGFAPIGVPVVSFNRDHDFLSVHISDVTFAAAYWVEILAPEAPYDLFTFDRDVSISGDTRNVFTNEFVKVFYPGFLQTMTVAAIDSNVYDYYRSGNDPFTGSGLINHLKGGLGLFGSVVVVDRRQVDVTQDSVDAIDGTYTPRGPNAGTASQHARSIRLYREALGGKTAPDRISGSLVRGPVTSTARAAIYGIRKADTLQLNLLNAQETRSLDAQLTVTVHGDSLIGFMNTNNTGNFSGTIAVTYVRAGK
jgi:hypothetical protein